MEAGTEGSLHGLEIHIHVRSITHFPSRSYFAVHMYTSRGSIVRINPTKKYKKKWLSGKIALVTGWHKIGKFIKTKNSMHS